MVNDLFKEAVYDWSQQCTYWVNGGLSIDEAIARAKQETEPRGLGFWMAVRARIGTRMMKGEIT